MSIIAGFAVPHPPLIIPQIGRGSEHQVDRTIQAYEQVAEKIAEIRPETVIISSPHAVMYSDYFHISPGRYAKGSFHRFGANNVRFDEAYDTELVDTICALADEKGFPAGTMGERDKELDHGVMVPLYFIRKKYQDFKLVRTGLSGLDLADHYALGMMIQKAAELKGRRAVYVASGDLSHKLKEHGPYGFAAEGPEYDERIMKVFETAEFGEMLEFDENFCDKAAECGHRSFVMMAGALDGYAVDTKVFSHEDVTGVGYGIAQFIVTGEDADRHFLDRYLKEKEEENIKHRAQEDPYVRLARQSMESYILDHETIDIPEWVPEELKKQRAGAFVSIHKHGRLRGCIGTILPVYGNVAEEIISNAVSASVRDPRFDPITADELKYLDINVDVLGEPEKISSKDQLDVKRYGVIVTRGAKRGLLLPDLEGVDSVEQQIAIAKRKAGIPEDAGVQLERFEVVRHT